MGFQSYYLCILFFDSIRAKGLPPLGAMAGFVFATTSSGLSTPCDQHSNHFTLLLHISVFLRDFLLVEASRSRTVNHLRLNRHACRLHQTSHLCCHQFTVVRTVLNWLVLWQHTSIWLCTHYSNISRRLTSSSSSSIKGSR